MKHFQDGRDWFFQKRFGMFIHWGIYAVGAVHEQEQQRCGLSPESYRQYMNRFNPRAFDPEAWLDLAEACGMEYVTFTSKHHDGFCMWDTRASEYKVTNTPYGRDVLAEVAAACHRRKMPLVVYYSVADWDQKSYPNLGRHHEIITDPKYHDAGAYQDYMMRQLREICTNYGEIHGIWWDMNVPGWQNPEINAMVRRLQPKAVISDRGLDKGDFTTPERDYQADPTIPFATPTEYCEAVGVGSWGYSKAEDYHSVNNLKHKLARNLALGGNFLLSVGPKADGSIPAAAQRMLREIGRWYKPLKTALVAPPQHGKLNNHTILCTGDDTELNLILLEAPDSSTLKLPPLKRLPKSVELLNFPSRLEATLEPLLYDIADGPGLRLRKLPVDRLQATVPVIRLKW